MLVWLVVSEVVLQTVVFVVDSVDSLETVDWLVVWVVLVQVVEFVVGS